MKFRKRYKILTGQISAVPFVNVVLLVVVYCLLMQAGQLRSAAKVERIFVNVAANGIIMIDNGRVSEDGLAGYLRNLQEEGKNLSVVIKAAEDTPYGAVTRVMNVIESAGVEKIAFAAYPEVKK